MMIRSNPRQTRRGVVLPLVAVCLIALIGLVALAIDIGMVAVAKTQAQNAADSAATAGVRSINGSTASNYANFDGKAVAKQSITTATQNVIFGKNVPGDPSNITANANGYSYSSGNVTVDVGAFVYVYDDTGKTTEQFVMQFPKTTATEPYDAVRSTVTYNGNWTFGRVFGASGFNVSAQAVSAHRPRDVMIIMDLSGSMKFQSLVGYPYFGARTQSMNPDTTFPQFGPYSNTAGAALQMPSPTKSIFDGTYTYDPNNISMDSTNNGNAVVKYFYSDPVAKTLAFSASSATNAKPNGDNFLYTNDNDTVTGTYAQSAAAVFKTNAGVAIPDADLNFERNGYQSTLFVTKNASFSGYTEGPGYWGKTFFVWPPDPRGPATATSDATNAANHANNGAKDWRQRFFFKVSGGVLQWMDDNAVLFNSSGYLQNPGQSTTSNGTAYTYRINYAAILNWVRNSAPTHFPTSMLTGRIQYWSDIPDPTTVTYTGKVGGLNQYFWTTADSGLTASERFWRGYIDWVLGFQNAGLSSGLLTYSTDDGSNRWTTYLGNGDLWTWGSVQISSKPVNTPNATGAINNAGGYAAGTAAGTSLTVSGFAKNSIAVGNYIRFGTDPTIYKVTAFTTNGSSQPITVKLDIALVNAVANAVAVKVNTSIPAYMVYGDIPLRPAYHYWFGPLTFVDYTGNYNMGQHWWPGNITEAQSWSCKAGIQTAIDDISNNHPNDYVGLTFFSTPIYSNGGSGHHNRAVVPLGRNYQNLKDSLWFPPTTVTGGVASITPYDTDFDQVPRANGGTTPEMGFLITYNMFSSSVSKLRLYSQPTATYKGFAGGMGRNGAARLVIFETDGVPNTEAQATLAGSGTDSYYPIRVYNPSKMNDPKNVEWPTTPNGSFQNSQVYGIVTQICAQTTASPPGYSTTRKPAQVWCIGYGSLYDPSGPGKTVRSNGMTFLQNIMYNSGTAPDKVGANFPDSLLVYGDSGTRVTRMQTAFTQIMQSGVQVSLLQ